MRDVILNHQTQLTLQFIAMPLASLESQVAQINIKLCLGYCGYIPGVKSENVFGESYGKTSGQSGRGEINRGFDQVPQEKFRTVVQASFQNPKEIYTKMRESGAHNLNFLGSTERARSRSPVVRIKFITV